MDEVRVVVADDEVLALNGISTMIDAMEGYKIVGKAKNGAECFDLVLSEKPQLIITDIKMPIMNGLEMIEKCIEADLNVTVIVVSAYDDREYLRRAIRSPIVYDYLFKPFRKEELVDALQGAYSFHQKYTGLRENDDEDLSRLVSYIFKKDVVSIDGFMENYFLDSQLSLKQLKNECYGWIMHVHNNVFADNKTRSFDSRGTMKQVFEAADKQQLKKVMEDYFHNCCDRFVTNDNITVLVKSCLRIIQSEYSNEEMNLNYCANKLMVTPNYLSSRFSRDIGKSFSSYVNELRMEKAKELLHNFSLRVYEVANAVGIRDISYFNKLFKDYEEKTPQQYRRDILKNDVDGEEMRIDT